MDATRRRRIQRPRTGGGTPAPTPTPTTIDKIVFEGTSITASYNLADNFAAAYPGCTVVNRAVGGSGIGTSADAPGALSIWGRKATVIADAPNLLALEPGQNDELDVSQRSDLLGYLTTIKTALPSIVIVVCTAFPRLDNPSHQANRTAWNAWLWSQLGLGLIDAIAPLGEHPLYSSDAAGVDPLMWGGGAHPHTSIRPALSAIYRAVIGPRMPVPVGEVSAISRLDLNNAPLSGVKYEHTMVSGLPFAGSATATVTGTGDASLGLLESYGASRTVYNGMIVKSRISASAANATSLTHTLGFNGASDAWTVRSASAAPLTGTYRSGATGAAGNAGSFSAGGITTVAGKKNIVFVNLRNNLIGTPTATLGGDAMTRLAGQVTGGNGGIFAFEVVPTAAGVGKTLAVTCTNIDEWGYDLITLDSTTATCQHTASKGFGYTQDPHITATALTVPAGGIGFIHELTYVAGVDPYIGTTEIGERSEYWIGSVADTCFPGSVHGGDFTFGMALAIAYGP